MTPAQHSGVAAQNVAAPNWLEQLMKPLGTACGVLDSPGEVDGVGWGAALLAEEPPGPPAVSTGRLRRLTR